MSCTRSCERSMIEPHPQGAPTTPNEGCGFRTRTMELVLVGIGEPEDRAPIFLLRRLRDLDALLAESGLFLRGVGRGEHVSRVTLLGSGVRAQMEVDVRASRRDRDPVRERRHHAEPELVLPELRGPLLISYDDRHRLELEHGRGNSGGPDKLAWAQRCRSR